MKRSSGRRLIWLGIGIGLIAVFVVVVMVLGGPLVGNTFSNILSDFETVRTQVPTGEVLRPTDEGEVFPTEESSEDEPTVSASPTTLPTKTPLSQTQPATGIATGAAQTTNVAVFPTQEAVNSSDDMTATSLIQDTDTATPEEDGQLPSTDDAGDQQERGTDVPFSSSVLDSELAVIGNGSAFVFHDEHVGQEENTLVELQVFFDEYYITATPTSAVTAVAAPELVRPEVDPQATRTPRAARFTEGDIDLPERLMAWLDCDDQFENCGDGGILPMRIQSPNSWRWSITPKEGVTGVQDLRVELWTVDAEGARDQRVWTHDFQIGVDVDPLVNNTNLIIMVLIGVIVLLVALFAVMRWRDSRDANRKRPKVFISYRRLASAGFGRTIHDALVEAGADVFIDIDDIHAGSFSEYIKENIRERNYFLVLLAPKTLESKWVIQEVLYAQEHGRTIIPILLNEFDLYGDEMPDNLTFLQQQNAVTLPVEHFESGIKRIKTFIGLK